jgi:hypothetical protein
LAPPKWSISSSGQGDQDRLNFEQPRKSKGGGGFVVEFVIISSSLSDTAVAFIKSWFGGELEGGLEVAVKLATRSLLDWEAETAMLLLLVLNGDDSSDEEVIVDETLVFGFSSEARISALSRYNEVRDEAADWKASQLSWSSAWLVFWHFDLHLYKWVKDVAVCWNRLQSRRWRALISRSEGSSDAPLSGSKSEGGNRSAITLIEENFGKFTIKS